MFPDRKAVLETFRPLAIGVYCYENIFVVRFDLHGMNDIDALAHGAVSFPIPRMGKLVGRDNTLICRLRMILAGD
jgi:hypothetical protein